MSNPASHQNKLEPAGVDQSTTWLNQRIVDASAPADSTNMTLQTAAIPENGITAGKTPTTVIQTNETADMQTLPDQGAQKRNLELAREAADLARLLRYAAINKDVEIQDTMLENATSALQAARDLLAGGTPKSPEDKVLTASQVSKEVLAQVDALGRRVYPATIASLEVAEAMSNPELAPDPRFAEEIKSKVKSLVTRWQIIIFLLLFIVILLTVLKETSVLKITGVHYETIISSTFGMLGASAYVSRMILQGLANNTYSLRENSIYSLRVSLGALLGYVVTLLIPTVDPQAGQTVALAAMPIPKEGIAFLAGYGVEAVFSGLDNLVNWLRDLLGRKGGPGTGKS